MVSSIWLSILCLSECQFLSLVSVGLLWSPWGTFFFLSFGSKCSFMASIFTVSFLPHVSMCPVLFGFKLDELHVTPCVFVYLLDLSKFLIWHSWNFLVLWYPSWHRHRSSCRLTCTQGSTSHYFSSALNPFAANAASIGNGKLAVLLPLLSMVVCL